MRNIFLFMFFPFFIFAQNNLNLSLVGSYEWPNTEGSDIWGWADPNGNEYALVGLNDGFSVVNINNPASPIEEFYISDLNSTWRDIKTWGNYAYVTTEADAGLLIVDLNDMTGGTYSHVSQFAGPNGSVEFTAAHNIYIDENGVAYIFGASSNTGNSPSDGAIFLDVAANPINPIYLGEWNDHYIHDGMARGDTMYASCIYAGELYVVDVSNKSNPINLGQTSTPDAFTHNSWVSDNGNYVFTTDEVSDAYITAYDITDVNNIQEVDRIQSNPGSGTIVHNTHVDGNFLITSYYRDGTTVHDITYPNNMIEVAYYDSYSGSGNGFDGCWGTYPFLPSGLIISSDINSSNNGTGKLLIYERGFSQACYLQGNVTDFSNGNALNGANVEILGAGSMNVTSTNLLGTYFSGTATASNYDIVFSKPGYISDTLSTNLTSGVLTTLDAQLSALPSFGLNGMVINISGIGIANSEVLIYNNDFSFNTITDNNGNFNIPTMYEGSYNIIVGKWGYITHCFTQYIDQNTSVTVTLDEGYYDDFTFDFSWSVSGGVGLSDPGRWERGHPEGTSYQGLDFNPDDDINTDCFNNAYVTGLDAGSSQGSNDVDDSNTILTSPIFDLSSNQPHYLSYYSWFSNGGGGWGPGASNANDSLKISVTNGNIIVELELMTESSPDMGQWNYRNYDLGQYLPLTSTMQLIIETADWDALGGHLVESGFDKFQVSSSPPVSLNEEVQFRNSKIVKIIDVLGRSVTPSKNIPLFYIYDNGSIEKKIILD